MTGIPRSSNHNYLRDKAHELRRTIFNTAMNAGKGHIPGAFSWVEIGVALYYGGIVNFKPDQPRWNERDIVVLSKGHSCLTLYSILSDLGYFPNDELFNYGKGGGMLAGHPDIEIPGIETCTGSLGHGLGVACGMSLSSKLNESKRKHFVILGDAECHEGSVWEAAMFAGHQKLGNLIAIIDRNGFGATDATENYGSIEPIEQRYQAFGWETIRLNGHEFGALLPTLHSAKERKISMPPLCIIAETIKGKGISFMQNSRDWHHQMPKGEQIEAAWLELGGKLD